VSKLEVIRPRETFVEEGTLKRGQHLFFFFSHYIQVLRVQHFATSSG
jgi:hypothetical protein